jgi:hypothetical protein
VPHLQLHAGFAQPVQPRSQQRRRFHVGRKYAARAADECLDPKPVHPLAQRVGAEAADERRELLTARAIAP